MPASIFLALPAEIRNLVYELALTSPEPLCLRASVEGGGIFNQVKFTNKRLYAETADLELQYNDLVLRAESWDECPAQMLLLWLPTIPPLKMTWVKTITLKYDVLAATRSCKATHLHARRNQVAAPDFPEDPETFRKLAEVCRTYPTMKIHYQLPAWVFDETDELAMFGHALQASFTFREIRLFNDLLYEFPTSMGLVPVLSRVLNVINLAVAWRKEIVVRDMWADNLRFFPTHTEEDRVSLKPSGPEGWQLVRKWVLEGI